MARNCFFSFHYIPDGWRASQVRNMGAIEGDKPVSDHDWETITKGGDAAIEKWIEDQMVGKSCVVVLVGADTAGRKWIKHEIKRGWELKKGVLGIAIHRLKNAAGNQSTQGANPFAAWKIGETPMNEIVQLHTPPHTDSQEAYNFIKANISKWVDDAVALRSNYA
jgi:hypothetical protein